MFNITFPLKLMVIKRYLPMLACCLLMAVYGGVGTAVAVQATSVATNQITQFGITWTFDKAYPTGQFANGDYWVVGPVNIIGISPLSIVDATGRTMNGSMINPSPRTGATQGYDSSMYTGSTASGYGGNFNSTLNVARPNQQDLSGNNPLQVPINSSLVSTISMSKPGVRPQLKTAAILTVLASVPPAGSFRPPYSGKDKSIRFNKSQLNYSLLGHLQPVANTPTMAKVERYFERPWLDHVPDWLGDYPHPKDNMPDYSRGMATQVGIGALMLNLNFTNTGKEKLLIRFVQLGIDLYGVAQDGGNKNWPGTGGESSGRKWPILFAGLMLNAPAMKNIGPGDGAGSIMFGEDGQTFYVAQSDINLKHTPDTRGGTPQEYTQADLGMAEWGIVHSMRPVEDNKAWSAIYRNCCTANSWAGEVLAARIMNAKALWAHDALFDYQDRYMAVLRSPGEAWLRSWDSSSFTTNMWDTYRTTFVTPATPAAPKVFPTILAVSSGTPGETSATITWNTDLAATSRVEYGLTSSYGSTTTPNSRLVTTHLVSLNNLTPNTTYHYRVSSADASANNTLSGDYTLTTLAVVDTTPPSVPATLSASAVSPTQINLSWTASTDNTGVTGYKVYRGGVQIGTTAGTAYNNTGLTASTSYSYAVVAYDAAGNNSGQSASISATTMAITPAPTSCLTTTTGSWKHTAFSSQTGSFTMQFDVTPQGYPVDAVTGLSTNPASVYNDLAVIVRFNNSGFIDVRNGGGYQALSQVSYSANTTYHFVITVNIPQHIYSVTVAPQGGTATTLAKNYAFRSSQATATTLSYLNTMDAPGPHTVCNTAVASTSSAPATPATPVTPVAPAVPASNDIPWFEDGVPAGALTGGRGEGWSWVTANPTPFSGRLAHQSAIAVGWSYHYFYNATPSQQVAVGDTLYTYVYLDPANPPTSIVIGWRTGRSWEQRAYWGVPAPWGTQGTASMRNMGALPATGGWIRLEIPASLVGLEGRSVDGMVFAELDGRATWDQTGKFQAASAPTFTISGTVTKNAAALSGVSFSGGTGVSCTTSDGSGNYSCTVTQGWSGTITPSLSGHTFTSASRSYTNVTVSQTVQDYSASVSTDVVWFEDGVPGGARTGGRGEGWSWVTANPTPFSGRLAHQSAITVGWSYHYFYNPTPSQQVAVGDTLYTYVYLDPANPPTSIAIGWRTGRSWEQRAYWGVPAPWGTQGTASMRNMGALPATGGWVRLEIPASLVGLEGRSVDGMVFAELDGRATWDQTGKF